MSTSINNASLRLIQAAAMAALKPVAEQFGITFSFDGGTLRHFDATLNLKVAANLPGGELNTPEALMFKRLAQGIGLKPEHLGQYFVFKGKRVKLLGYNPKASRYPIIGQDLARQTARYTVQTAIVGFRLAEPLPAEYANLSDDQVLAQLRGGN